MNPLFFKFPSTPHLSVLGNSIVRDDKVLSIEQRDHFLKNILSVEEKIDGANLGISFDEAGTLILQNRGSVLTKPYSGQWEKLEKWLKDRTKLVRPEFIQTMEDHWSRKKIIPNRLTEGHFL